MFESEIDDYNRGRKYLIDVAKRHNLVILNDDQSAGIFMLMMFFLSGMEKHKKSFNPTFLCIFIFFSLYIICNYFFQ